MRDSPGPDAADKRIATRASEPAAPAGSGGPEIPRARSGSELKARMDAARDGEPFLVFKDAAGADTIVSLGATPSSLSVGRSLTADVSLAWDPQVSRLHALVERVADEVVVVDDGLSSYGTFVDGERVNGRRRLRDGDAIRVGSTVLLFCRRDLTVEATSRGEVGVSLAQLSENQRRILSALCRPYLETKHLASPASNKVIAQQTFLAEATVKANLRSLFQLFDLERDARLAQNQKRARLAEKAIAWGLVSRAPE
jgi:pSer/pThr/pTyr-binding forkhead associated (FHA) protein